MDHNNSVKIDVPQLRVHPPIPIKASKIKPYKKKWRPEKVSRKPSDNILRKYSLLDTSVRGKIFEKNEFLLSFRHFTKEQRFLAQKRRQAIPVQERYKIIATGLQNRLHVEHPPNDVKTITDIDDDYFKFVDGRLLPRRGACYKSLSHFFCYRLRKRMEIGYRNDSMLNIDQNFIKEQKKYDMTVNQYMDQVKYFDRFISEDYLNSMACMEKWEKVKDQVNLKSIELQNIAAEIFTTTSRLILLDYKYTLQQKYGRFLYFLSSPTWRAQNREFAQSIEIETTGFDVAATNDDDSFSVLFDKMQRECVSTYVKPALYFNHPSEFMDVLDTIQQHQQHHFIHVSRIAVRAKSLKRAVSILKEMIAQDTCAVANSVEGFEKQIKFFYERSRQLEDKFMKILHGLFYQSVGAAEVLKFSLHLEFCFEKVCNEKPINMDIVAMAKALEDTCMFYVFQLEGMRGENVRQSIAQCMKEEKRKNKRAKEAAKELRLFERLEHELLLSFAPVPKKGEIILQSNHKPFYTKKIAPKKNIRNKSLEVKKMSLTEAEKEYLTLFTEWTENQDPSLYLHSQNT